MIIVRDIREVWAENAQNAARSLWINAARELEQYEGHPTPYRKGRVIRAQAAAALAYLLARQMMEPCS